MYMLMLSTILNTVTARLCDGATNNLKTDRPLVLLGASSLHTLHNLDSCLSTHSYLHCTSVISGP